jgi:shikimate dehydrogenase
MAVTVAQAAGMERYAVFGYPIKHSKSPSIHSAFARQTSQSMEYFAREISPENFEQDVAAFFASGGKGLNITVPFKERAWAMAQEHSAASKVSGAANTLYMNESGHLCADNTDGVGMLRDIIANLHGTIHQKSILLVGAGGAVRGVLPSLLAEGPTEICIVNRTLDKAQQLAQSVGGTVTACSYSDLGDSAFDWVINGTSVGLQGGVPPLPVSIFKRDTCCYDMVYGDGDTAFQSWSKQHGAKQAHDGLGMLVEQAAESFFIWRGVKPNTAEMIVSLRNELNPS